MKGAIIAIRKLIRSSIQYSSQQNSTIHQLIMNSLLNKPSTVTLMAQPFEVIDVTTSNIDISEAPEKSYVWPIRNVNVTVQKFCATSPFYILHFEPRDIKKNTIPGIFTRDSNMHTFY
ncbi:unnamed protein product [Rotaria magnacalcarata]|uniref:Uncharacterized protein n=1 Tax=Rotaria magnacalcarata TaxID=392030 RepID=A0A816WD10_9BILA|nr:unnamed protein product [Rotaria magnacalcarata]